jgi:hypothetical protein
MQPALALILADGRAMRVRSELCCEVKWDRTVAPRGGARRKGAAIFATLLLPGQTLPPLQRLALPFVIDAPGGIDGSWPTTALQEVTLLGGKSVPYAWSDSAGLLLRIQTRATVAAPYAAVFKLQYWAVWLPFTVQMWGLHHP